MRPSHEFIHLLILIVGSRPERVPCKLSLAKKKKEPCNWRKKNPRTFSRRSVWPPLRLLSFVIIFFFSSSDRSFPRLFLSGGRKRGWLSTAREPFKFELFLMQETVAGRHDVGTTVSLPPPSYLHRIDRFQLLSRPRRHCHLRSRKTTAPPLCFAYLITGFLPVSDRSVSKNSPPKVSLKLE